MQAVNTGLLGLFLLLFVGLKLGGIIAWSWWWVLSPLWLPPAIVLSIFLTGLFFVFFVNKKWRK